MGTQTLEVEVTDNDIYFGNSGKSYSCPIALAILRTHPGAVVQADVEITSIDGDLYETSRRAADFMDAFDCGRNVRPSRFRFRAYPKGG